MFGIYPDKMPPESTPERVYALFRLVSKRPSTRKNLRSAMVMKDVFGDRHQDVFSKTFKCADELGLISEKDGNVNATVDIEVLGDYVSFRKFVAQRVFNNKETTFFKVTEWYLAKNEKVYSLLNWEKVAAEADRDGINIRENDMLGWRWWASFLGLGYLHDTILVVNLATRIKDFLEGKTFPVNQRVSAGLFVESFESVCPEAKSSRNGVTLGLGVSNGLRVLEKEGGIELPAQRDAERVNLFPIDGLPQNDFSHVIIKR